MLSGDVDVALPIKLVLAKPVVIFYFEAAGELSQLNVTNKVTCNLT